MYLLRDRTVVGERVGSTCTYVEVVVGGYIVAIRLAVAQDSGFILLARDTSHLPRDMPRPGQKEKQNVLHAVSVYSKE
jgi:hypothetical protein